MVLRTPRQLQLLTLLVLPAALAKGSQHPDTGIWECNVATCFQTTIQNASLVVFNTSRIVIYDDAPCWNAIKLRLGHVFDLSRVSASEMLLCSSLMRCLIKLGYNLLVTRHAKLADKVIKAGRAKNVSYIFIVYQGHNKIPHKKVQDRNIVKSPFREECLISVYHFPVQQPVGLWPGDLKNYVTIYPNGMNAYVGHTIPIDCAIISEEQLRKLPPYSLVFGKFSVMPWKLHQLRPFLRSAWLWKALRERLQIVFTDCSDGLADSLQLGPSYKEQYVCWKDVPPWANLTYRELIRNAAFLLGLGSPGNSPTPVESLYCRTPVVMPDTQHQLLKREARPDEYYPVDSAKQVIMAADSILHKCRPTYVPYKPAIQAGQQDGQMSGLLEKVNEGCFFGPHSLEPLLSEDVIIAQLEALLNSRKQTCQ